MSADRLYSSFVSGRSESADSALRYLLKERAAVLAEIHSMQQELDLIDYRICQLKKSGKEKMER